MNADNTKKLYDRFPALYAEHSLPMTQTCMCWGFECDNGWFDLIWMLSLALEDESKQSNAPIVAQQVKEKFGGLRFYISGNERAYSLAYLAENASYQVCETCGSNSGRMHHRGTWLKTLCVKCGKAIEGYVPLASKKLP
jgi:hypothetical protein